MPATTWPNRGDHRRRAPGTPVLGRWRCDRPARVPAGRPSELGPSSPTTLAHRGRRRPRRPLERTGRGRQADERDLLSSVRGHRSTRVRLHHPDPRETRGDRSRCPRGDRTDRSRGTALRHPDDVRTHGPGADVAHEHDAAGIALCGGGRVPLRDWPVRMLAYFVAQRGREIGVRLAIGSAPRAIVGLVLREGLGLAVGGVAVGVLAR